MGVNGAARGNRFDRSRDQINAEQGCNFSSEKFGGLASEFIVFDREKRWGKSSNDQYERIKESGPLCTLQDGRSVSAERSAIARVPGDFMCKINLKDAYFLVPLSQNSQKYDRFQWKGLLYKFLCIFRKVICNGQRTT